MSNFVPPDSYQKQMAMGFETARVGRGFSFGPKNESETLMMTTFQTVADTKQKGAFTQARNNFDPNLNTKSPTVRLTKSII